MPAAPLIIVPLIAAAALRIWEGALWSAWPGTVVVLELAVVLIWASGRGDRLPRWLQVGLAALLVVHGVMAQTWVPIGPGPHLLSGAEFWRFYVAGGLELAAGGGHLVAIRRAPPGSNQPKAP